MKLLFLAFLILLFSGTAPAQQKYLDSLHHLVNHAKEDTSKVLALLSIAEYYGFNHFDSAFVFAQRTIELSKKLDYAYGHSQGLRALFYAFNCQGNYPRALEVTLQNFKIAEKIKSERPWNFSVVNYFIGLLNSEMGNYSIAIKQFHEAIRINQRANLPLPDVFFAYSQLAIVYLKLKRPDSALWYAQKGFDLSLQSNWSRYKTLASAVLGKIHNVLGHYELAKKYYSLGLHQSKIVNNTYFIARNYNNLAELFNKTGYHDSSIYYARLSLQLCQEHNFSEYALDASSLLSKIYESQNKPDSTIKYMKIMLAAKDSVLGQSKVKEFEKFVFDDKQQQQEIQKAQEESKNRMKMFALLAGMLVFFLIAILLYRNNKQKQQANYKIEKAYKDLKSTQAQLIQSEKMASLGELTAGIAHEIQNPLNFVNNFSEVNKELLVEMENELNAGNKEEAILIAKDIKENEQKINHHGKRADAIVKGMLQHSRSSNNIKELTDINVLAGEYLRLSFHGIRAKDKTFNATIQTEFDDSIEKINVIPHDIGRVILNLFNNAFYSVTQKKKQEGNAYEPMISLSTKKIADKVEIRVKDNGIGIPQKILDKIFQPFFTTKPTGEGTGLGLSLSYDIIEAHGGEIKVETKEARPPSNDNSDRDDPVGRGEYTEFIIHLPVI